MSEFNRSKNTNNKKIDLFKGLYVNDDDQDWGSAGMNDVQEDISQNKLQDIKIMKSGNVSFDLKKICWNKKRLLKRRC